MSGGSLYNAIDLEKQNNPQYMFDLAEEKQHKGSPHKFKFNTVSDIYLEQYKVARF